MALSDQLAAYEDCFNLYERAKTNIFAAKFENPDVTTLPECGARALFPTEKDATLFRMRLHQARSLARRESMRLYERTDPLYGKSEFDDLICRVHEGATPTEWWVYIEPHGQEVQAIEFLYVPRGNSIEHKPTLSLTHEEELQ